MKLYTFIYIVLNLIVLQLISLDIEMINIVLQVLCCAGILTIGIAHGSLDHILYGVDSEKSNRNFIFIYVLVMFAFIGLWAFSITTAATFFLLISAYHFGQSQFEEYQFGPPLLNKLLYVLWGSIVIISPMAFNSSELMALNNQFDTSFPILNFFLLNASKMLIVCIGLFLATFLILANSIKLPLHTISMELFLIFLILVSFKLIAPFIAFSLFFIFIHSLRVVTQEYQFCHLSAKINSGKQFLMLCFPLTLVSILGIALLSGVLYFYDAVNLIPLALIIVLSGVTLPHSIVMEKFYKQLR